MQSYSVRAQLSVDDKGFTSSMTRAAQAAQQLSNEAAGSAKGIGKMGAAFAVANKLISAGVDVMRNSIGAAVKRFDTMSRFPKVMEQLGFKSSDAAASVQKLSDGVSGLPTALDEITANTQQLALLTGDLEKATDTSIALNDAFFASGASSADAARGLTQYVQMLSKGTVDAQSWRTLLETMGVALNDVAASFGFTGAAAKNDLYEALQSGMITFDQMNERLVELDGGVNGFAARARTASQGIATSMQNIAVSIVKGLANTIQTVDTAFQNTFGMTIPQVLDSGKGKVNEFFDVFNSSVGRVVPVVASGFKVLGKNIDIVGVAVGGLAIRFAALKVIDATKSKIEGFKSATKAAANQIKQYNSALQKYGTAQKAAKAATEAAKSAEEKRRRASKLSEAALRKEEAAMRASEQAERARIAALKEGGKNTALNTEYTKKSAAASKLEAEAKKKNAEASRLNAQASAQEVAAQNAQSSATTLTNSQIGLQTVALSVLSGQMKITTAVQQGLNAAMSANPIGFAITAITALVTSYKMLTKVVEHFNPSIREERERLEELNEGYEEAKNGAEEFIKGADETTESMANEASETRRLVSHLKAYLKEAQRSDAVNDKIEAKVAELNNRVSGLGLSYDAATKSINMTNEALETQIQIAEAQQSIETYTQTLNEAREQEVALTQELAQHEARLAEMKAQGAEAYGRGIAASNKYRFELQEEQNKIDELKGKHEEIAERVTTLSEERSNAAELASQAIRTAIDNETISMEQLSESNQQIVSDLQGQYASFQESATSAFDVINTKTDLTAQKMIENAQANKQATQQWGENMTTLRNAVSSWDGGDLLIQKFESMGLDGAAELQALVDGGDSSMQELAGIMSEGATTASDSFVQGMGLEDIDPAIQSMITEVQTSMLQQARAADWASVGTDIGTGLGQGITDSSSIPTEASTQMSDDTINASKDAFESHSPSRVFEGIGKDIVSGLALGLKGKTAVSAARRMSKQVVTAVQQAVRGMQNSANTASFNQLVVNARNAMTQTRQAFVTGFTSMRTTVTSSMNTIRNAFATGMNRSKSAVSSGMSSISAAVTSGMNQAAAAASAGANRVVSAVANGYGRMYTAGAQFGMGYANGLQSQLPAITRVANEYVRQAERVIKAKQQSQSPSRLAMGLGSDFGEGYFLGLEDWVKPIKTMAARYVDAASSIRIPDMSKEFGRLQFAGEMRAFTHEMDINIAYEIADLLDERPIEVNVPLYVNDREFAKATTSAINNQMDDNARLDAWRTGVKA